jgi:hypothetical protein
MAIDEAVELIAETREPEVATVRRDGSPGFIPIWVVRVGDELFARSFHGPSAVWYEHALSAGRTTLRVGGEEWPVEVSAVGATHRAEIDEAYRIKHGGHPEDGQYVPAMVSDAAVATTVQFRIVD